MPLDVSHDPAIESWVDSANAPGADFPIQHLPLCMYSYQGSVPRVGVGIGDFIFDVPQYSSLEELMAGGRAASRALRLRLIEDLGSRHPHPPRERLHAISECELHLPCRIGDYTDFFASIFHATNVGALFRPGKPLSPNYKHLPIAYHGRASSIVVSGTPVHRPSGQIETRVFAPSRKLDYECELGAFIGRANPLGHPVAIGDAEDHLFGVSLLNDWSARDIQSFESQPLGPFLSKSFATTVSPWITTLDALEPFRAPRYSRPEGDPEPLPYLDSTDDRERGGIDLKLEVTLLTLKMRAAGLAPVRVSGSSFLDMYWTFAQMLAHHTSNGCNLRTADLIASGTASGPGDDAHGCLLERTEPLQLPGGETREFLEDGDQVALSGFAESEGFRRIGLGECRGTLALGER